MISAGEMANVVVRLVGRPEFQMKQIPWVLLNQKGRDAIFRRRGQVKKLIALMLVTMLAGCAATGPKSAGPETAGTMGGETMAAGMEQHKHGAFTKHYESSLFEVTKNGLYSVEMVLGDHELKTGLNAVDLIIHDKRDHDVVGAEVTVTPWMPEMGHGSFEDPVVTEKGGGLYSVERVALIMSGLWELRINITKEGEEDSAVFSFPDVQVDRKHAHKAVQVPANLDLATEQMSENKKFILSYQTVREKIPVNKIHEWLLSLKTPGGEPISGAEITLDGDMPQHGHGLPTKPEVTQDLGNGEYVAEGVQFSMPGWWVMKFTVRAGGEVDTVTFNLVVVE